MGLPRFETRHFENHLPSTHCDTSNRCQAEDVRVDIGNGNQDDDANFDIGNWNQSMDVSFDIGNGNQDNNASIYIGNGNQGRDAGFKVHEGIENGRDAIHGVDGEVVEHARAFQSLGTEGIF